MAVESDPARKVSAQLEMAQMLLDAGSNDKALTEFRVVLAAHPDSPGANLGVGLALFSSGDSTKYQAAANYLQHFVDVAPDSDPMKADAKSALTFLQEVNHITPKRS